MGSAKDRAIHEDEQGWQFSPGIYICYQCLTDKELSAHVKENANGNTCSFCDRTTKRPSTVPFDELMEIIGSARDEYYDRAVNVLGWDGEEDRYVGTTYDSWDLVWDFAISEHEKVNESIADALGDETWCDRYPYSTTGYKAYQIGWERFCETVKHETRYFFTRQTSTDDFDITPVAEVLREITSMLEQQELVHTLDFNTMFIRCRVHKTNELCQDWRTLGSPPPHRAPNNRMSPAGISMFYASTNRATAIAEAQASLQSNRRIGITTGTWVTTRVLHVLDLTRIPAIPSFWFAARYERDVVLFLRDFTESITQPVVHDGREHIEYVPTQILTEYLRHEYRTNDQRRLDGIIYPSAQVSKGCNVVIFAGQDDLTPLEEQEYTNKNPPLILKSHRIERPYATTAGQQER